MKKILMTSFILISSISSYATGDCTVSHKYSYKYKNEVQTKIIESQLFYVESYKECVEMAQEKLSNIPNAEAIYISPSFESNYFGGLALRGIPATRYNYIEYKYSKFDYDLGLFNKYGRLQSKDDKAGMNSVFTKEKEVLVK